MITSNATSNNRRLAKSSIAVFLGLLAIIVLSMGTDQILHSLQIYPPWGQPMYDTSLNLLALAYRSVYAIVGSYIAARLAPHAPMRHALVLGGVGLLLSVMGAIAMWDFGPNWFPVSLMAIALPAAWLGGALYLKLHWSKL